MEKDRKEYIDKWRPYILELHKLNNSAPNDAAKLRVYEIINELIKIAETNAQTYALEEQILRDYATRSYHGD